MVSFTINGKEYTVGPETSPTHRLIDFIRGDAGLTGTKITCRQGGCGVCVVTAKVPQPGLQEKKTISLQACLANVHNCDGWEITTVEGLASNGELHPIQQAVVDHYATQCGFCTPGFIMNMHGFTESKSSWTEDEAERNLDGHLCRCTGYRPILDAFKSLKPPDIEDLRPCTDRAAKAVASSGCGQQGGCCRTKRALKKKVELNGTVFYYPTTTEELLSALASLPDGSSHQIMFGNTGIGITGDLYVDAVVSMRGITELTHVDSSSPFHVEVGASVSVDSLMSALGALKDTSGYEYLAELLDLWANVGSTALRCLCSWAGNLALKSQINSFQSDLFISLVGCGAQVQIGNPNGQTEWVLVETLVNRNLSINREVILYLRLMRYSSQTRYNNYKVMPRSCTSLAFINASFKMDVQDYKVMTSPIIAYGGINENTVRAARTEAALSVGSDLTDEAVLHRALDAITEDIHPDGNLLNPPEAYRVDVAKGFLYKYLMGIISSSSAVDSYFVSGSEKMVRATSRGEQKYDSNEDTWPLGKPMPKLEAASQATGDIKFNMDMPELPGTLIGKFVQSTKANAKLDGIDFSEIFSVPGITGFVSAEDIRGKNDMQPFDIKNEEPVFASGRVLYHGQALGLLVGESYAALAAALPLVRASYSDVRTPVLTIDDALKQNKMPQEQPLPTVVGDVDHTFENCATVVEGEMLRNSQFHFHLEMQACYVVPFEDSFEVTATTQWTTGTQAAVATVLGVENNKVAVTVHRLGGAFGAKIDMGNLVHAAAAVAAQKFKKPVHVVLDIQTNMSLIGWREAYKFVYKAGVDEAGKLQAVRANMIADSGCLPIDSSASLSINSLPNCYYCPEWDLTPTTVLTDTACNTWCRTPGTNEGITCMEVIMDHLATDLGMDPLELRKLNLIPDGSTRLANTLPKRLRHLLIQHNIVENEIMKPFEIKKNYLPDMISQIEEEAEVSRRKLAVKEFNNQNRWRKRGLAVMPMLWPYEISPVYGFGVLISIYAIDGTVAVAPGGVEMGQGLNTKVAQIAAYELGCDMDVISVKPANTLAGANSMPTSGSCGSNVNLYCTQQAAKKIRARLDKLPGDTWKEKVLHASAEGISLTEYYWNGKDEVKQYVVYGVACTEVELDILTGNFMVLRTDVLEDVGTSPSPLIDIGQIEGGWLMSQGLHTTEGPVYDPDTGAKLNIDCWHYKAPMARDIPNDFRVQFLSNAPCPEGVADSKVSNEPPMNLGYSVPMALREAVGAARRDAGAPGHFRMDHPLTVDNLQQLCLVDPAQFAYSRD